MASNQTQNYGLSQWELTDDVRMEDFNSDNAKIDAALAQLMGAYTPTNKPYVIGIYTGDGAETRIIEVGFTPAAVLVMQDGSMVYYSGKIYGGLAIPGFCTGQALSEEWVSGTSALTVVEGGFQVGYVSDRIRTNASSSDYVYIAFR